MTLLIQWRSLVLGRRIQVLTGNFGTTQDGRLVCYLCFFFNSRSLNWLSNSVVERERESCSVVKIHGSKIVVFISQCYFYPASTSFVGFRTTLFPKFLRTYAFSAQGSCTVPKQSIWSELSNLVSESLLCIIIVKSERLKLCLTSLPCDLKWSAVCVFFCTGTKDMESDAHAYRSTSEPRFDNAWLRLYEDVDSTVGHLCAPILQWCKKSRIRVSLYSEIRLDESAQPDL